MLSTCGDSHGSCSCSRPSQRSWSRAFSLAANRLDEAFLFERSIDIDTYDRHAEKLREELTLARIDRHSGQLEELDVEGILAFAERILRRTMTDAMWGTRITSSVLLRVRTMSRSCGARCGRRITARCRGGPAWWRPLIVRSLSDTRDYCRSGGSVSGLL